MGAEERRDVLPRERERARRMNPPMLPSVKTEMLSSSVRGMIPSILYC